MKIEDSEKHSRTFLVKDVPEYSEEHGDLEVYVNYTKDDSELNPKVGPGPGAGAKAVALDTHVVPLLKKSASLEQENKKLRIMLGIALFGNKAYTDDGECQVMDEKIYFDFKRDPLNIIEINLAERANRILRKRGITSENFWEKMMGESI